MIEASRIDAPRLASRPPQKWRPSLSLVVFLVLTAVLLLPLFSLYFLRVYQNQLIQQTEAELIAQSWRLNDPVGGGQLASAGLGVGIGREKFEHGARRLAKSPQSANLLSARWQRRLFVTPRRRGRGDKEWTAAAPGIDGRHLQRKSALPKKL